MDNENTYLESVNREVMSRERELSMHELDERFPKGMASNGYSSQEVEAIRQRNLNKARQEYLEKMDFNSRVKQRFLEERNKQRALDQKTRQEQLNNAMGRGR